MTGVVAERDPIINSSIRSTIQDSPFFEPSTPFTFLSL